MTILAKKTDKNEKKEEKDVEKIRNIIIRQIEHFGNLVLSGEYITDQMCGYAGMIKSLVEALRELEEIH